MERIAGYGKSFLSGYGSDSARNRSLSRRSILVWCHWARFLSLVNEDRITQAENLLRGMLAVSDLQGKRFLNVGSHGVPNLRASVLAGQTEDRS